MMKLNILVIEDNDEQFKTYQSTLEVDELDDKYNLIQAKTLESANKLIEKETINAAILDLSIPYSNKGKENPRNGIKYLEILLKEKVFPIVVVSAHAELLDDCNPKIPIDFIEKFPRESEVHRRVFEHFEKIKGLLEISPIISKSIKEIRLEFLQLSFLELWKHWEKLSSRFEGEGHRKIKTSLKRYMCSYVVEKSMADNAFNKMHHSEFYTHPPVRDRIHTGDIIEEDNKFWIVVTAPCDLSNGELKYPENLTLLECESENKIPNKKIGELFTKQEDRAHYLPPWEVGGKPVRVIFKSIKTIPFKTSDSNDEELREKIKNKRVACLSSHFLPYFLQRYGAYVSRIGQPDIDADIYYKRLSSQTQSANNP